MNAGTIVGHITRPNGSPVSGAEIWISSPGECGSGEAKSKFAVKTDMRGYFQLTFNDGAGIAGKVEIGGRLCISVGTRKSGRANGESRDAESHFQMTGYLIKSTSPAHK